MIVPCANSEMETGTEVANYSHGFMEDKTP